jgi:3-isopropylmalate dehydratase small subunit
MAKGTIFKFHNDLDTDQIIASQYLLLPNLEEMKEHAFESLDPDFPKKVKPGDFVVGGENFGCGSSREQAPGVLKALGVQAIVAKSFARIFYRNAINIGLPVIVCKELPDVQFIFAGTGPLEESIKGVSNIKNVGFQKGEALEKLIREARFSIYPSEWYENCPFSVMESQMYGTPVLGADIGGIPELIQVGKTGELFKSGDGNELKSKIRKKVLSQNQACPSRSLWSSVVSVIDPIPVKRVATSTAGQ